MTAAFSSALPSSTHLITLPVPSPQQQTTLVAHTTHFNGSPSRSATGDGDGRLNGQSEPSSLYIWCGESNAHASALGDAAAGSMATTTTTSSSAAAPHSSLLEEAYYAVPMPDPRENTNEDTQDLSALEMPPTGILSREWAVAMTRRGTAAQSGSTAQHVEPAASVMSTSLFHTNSDMAKPMAARLSRRFGISQLFLSLSLPEQLLACIEGPFAGPEGAKALLLLESALGQVIKDETSGGS